MSEELLRRSRHGMLTFVRKKGIYTPGDVHYGRFSMHARIRSIAILQPPKTHDGVLNNNIIIMSFFLR